MLLHAQKSILQHSQVRALPVPPHCCSPPIYTREELPWQLTTSLGCSFCPQSHLSIGQWLPAPELGSILSFCISGFLHFATHLCRSSPSRAPQAGGGWRRQSHLSPGSLGLDERCVASRQRLDPTACFWGVGLGPAALGGRSQGSPGTPSLGCAAQTAPARGSLCPQLRAQGSSSSRRRCQGELRRLLLIHRLAPAPGTCWQPVGFSRGRGFLITPFHTGRAKHQPTCGIHPLRQKTLQEVNSLFSKKKLVARKELKAAGIVKNLITPPDTSPRLREAPDAPTARRVSLQSLCTSGPSPGHCSDISALALGAAFPSPRWLG